MLGFSFVDLLQRRSFSSQWGRHTLAAKGFCEGSGVCRMCMAALARVKLYYNAMLKC